MAKEVYFNQSLYHLVVELCIKIPTWLRNYLRLAALNLASFALSLSISASSSAVNSISAPGGKVVLASGRLDAGTAVEAGVARRADRLPPVLRVVARRPLRVWLPEVLASDALIAARNSSETGPAGSLLDRSLRLTADALAPELCEACEAERPEARLAPVRPP